MSDRYYEQVADEIASGRIDKATWTRCYADAEGNDSKAQALYIKARVRQLEKFNREVMKAQLEETARVQRAQDNLVREQFDSIDRRISKLISQKNKYQYLGLFIGFVVFWIMAFWNSDGGSVLESMHGASFVVGLIISLIAVAVTIALTPHEQVTQQIKQLEKERSELETEYGDPNGWIGVIVLVVGVILVALWIF